MMLLDKMALEFETQASNNEAVDLSFIKKLINRLAWEWFDDHQGMVLAEVGFWFIQLKVRVRDLDGAFETLFGPRGLA